MSTTEQKQTARTNVRKAQEASATGRRAPKRGSTLTTAERNDLPNAAFAFTDKRKAPLVDANHVRNAVARFDQVEDVTDAERDKAWRKIRAAARKFDVEIHERGWRPLFEGGKAHKR
jgi:hypothetical protein